MNIKIIRGAFLNPFELQNFTPLIAHHNIEVISSKFPLSDKIGLPLKKLWSPSDIPSIPFKYPILNRLFIDGQILYGLEKLLKNTDIAHVAETYFGYTYQAIRAKQIGLVKKIVSTVWETKANNNQSLTGRAKIKSLAIKNIDHFIAITELAKKALLKEGVEEKKITVIPMGVDINRFKPRPKIKNKRDINILCVARLVPEKGIRTLFEAFQILKPKHKNLTVTFVGDGPLKKEISGFKGVFVKKVPYQKMPEEYSRADIFCLPSLETSTWEEQFGMCLVEAMASGLPIVASKSGAIPEVCGGLASLVEPGNPHKLAHALEKLIYNKEARERLGKELRQRAIRNFNHLKISEQIGAVYQKLLCR